MNQEEIKTKSTTELTNRLKEITLLNRELEAEYRMIAHELWDRVNTPEEGMKLERTKDELQRNSR